VFSTDLIEATADLKILVRLTNLTGDPGRSALASFTAANFRPAAVPDPANTLTWLIADGVLIGRPAAGRSTRRDRV
jgi:hypothetical protein